MLTVSLILFLLIGCGIVPYFLLSGIQTTHLDLKNHFGKNTAIVLFGLGTLKVPKTNIIIPPPLALSRINKAASLYHACKNEKNGECTIIISGGDPMNTGQSEASVYQTVLVQLKVNHQDIILEPHSKNTFENARLTNEIIKKHSFDTIYLATSNFHSKRANLYCSHFGLKITPCPGDYLKANLSLIPTAYNFTLCDIAIHEYIGILRYFIYNFLKLNA